MDLNCYDTGTVFPECGWQHQGIARSELLWNRCEGLLTPLSVENLHNAILQDFLTLASDGSGCPNLSLSV